MARGRASGSRTPGRSPRRRARCAHGQAPPPERRETSRARPPAGSDDIVGELLAAASRRAKPAADAAFEAELKAIVRPHLAPEEDADLPRLREAVDEARSGLLRADSPQTPDSGSSRRRGALSTFSCVESATSPSASSFSTRRARRLSRTSRATRSSRARASTGASSRRRSTRPAPSHGARSSGSTTSVRRSPMPRSFHAWPSWPAPRALPSSRAPDRISSAARRSQRRRIPTTGNCRKGKAP